MTAAPATPTCSTKLGIPPRVPAHFVVRTSRAGSPRSRRSALTPLATSRSRAACRTAFSVSAKAEPSGLVGSGRSQGWNVSKNGSESVTSALAWPGAVSSASPPPPSGCSRTSRRASTGSSSASSAAASASSPRPPRPVIHSRSRSRREVRSAAWATAVSRSTGTPAPSASSTARPGNGTPAKPNIAQCASSEVGARPQPKGRCQPLAPPRARASRFGVCAASAGVRPPSSGIGRSPSPSSTTRTIGRRSSSSRGWVSPWPAGLIAGGRSPPR